MFSLHIDTSKAWRGGQSHVMHTVMGLRAHGDRAAIVAHPEGQLLRRMSEGLDLIPLAPRNEIDLSAAWRLSRVLKDLRPEVVHAYDPHAIAMAATALSIASPVPRPALVASRRVPFVVAHNSFSRWKYGQVDCFIASTNSIRDRLVADGIPRRKTTVVHEGVDVERIVRLDAGGVHAAFYLPTHAPVIGNVAALVPHKGHHHLIDAAALVVQQVPDARFVILGDGELRDSLEAHIRHKHMERHVFLGGYRPDALELTKSVDVFAISSVADGTCRAVVDAMAASKPVVATSVGGIPELVVDGSTGFLVAPRDDRAMAERLVMLLRDPGLRQQMGNAGLARARAHFTVERMVEETRDVYRRLGDMRREADIGRRAALGRTRRHSSSRRGTTRNRIEQGPAD